MFRLTRNFFYFIFCIPKNFGTESSHSSDYQDNVHHTHKKNDKQFFDMNGILRNV